MIRAHTKLFNKPFQMNACCLVGEASFSESASSMGQPPPELFLMGYCPDYAGEVRGKLLNAYVVPELDKLDLDEEYNIQDPNRNTIDDSELSFHNFSTSSVVRTGTCSEGTCDGSTTLVDSLSSVSSDLISLASSRGSRNMTPYNPLQGLRIVFSNNRYEVSGSGGAYTYRQIR